MGNIISRLMKPRSGRGSDLCGRHEQRRGYLERAGYTLLHFWFRYCGNPKFVDQVLSSLDAKERPVVSGLGMHFNIFDLYDDSAIRSQFPRGFPYAARIGYQPWAVHDVAHSDVLMHLGLWRGVLDINAVDRVSLQRHEFPDAAL